MGAQRPVTFDCHYPGFRPGLIIFSPFRARCIVLKSLKLIPSVKPRRQQGLENCIENNIFCSNHDLHSRSSFMQSVWFLRLKNSGIRFGIRSDAFSLKNLIFFYIIRHYCTVKCNKSKIRNKIGFAELTVSHYVTNDRLSILLIMCF
jgi:hypothetical protein